MACTCLCETRAAGGEGSRTVIDLEKLKEAGWIVETTGKRYKLQSPLPKRKRFRSTKDVSEFLKSQNMFEQFTRCNCGQSFPRSSISEFQESSESDCDYMPDTEEEVGTSSAYDDTPVKREGYCQPLPSSPLHVARRLHQECEVKAIELPIGYYVGMTNQLDGLLDQVNSTRQCKTHGCDGILVPTTLERKGLGGAIKLKMACSGCGTNLQYASSMVCLKERRRNCVSLALGLCFLIWGHGYPAYHKILKLGLGISTLTGSNFYNIIKLAHPHVKTVLDEICEMGKSEMKEKPPLELGSWEKAVTTSDGCWLIRGHHSQCCTFVIINFLSGCTLYYGHACMRGSNQICDSEIWEGTAKAAEGHLAEVCFSKAKEEGMVIAINWQDADSSSAKSFRYVFPDNSISRVMLCGGHVGRSHANNLKDYKGKKAVDTSFVATHKKDYPQLATAKCECHGKRAHSKKCGCMSDEFLGRAKSNHFSALKQSGNNPEEYASRMRILGKYHSRDIHEWVGEDGKLQRCPWHPQHVCSCGNCDKEGVITVSATQGAVGERQVEDHEGDSEDSEDGEDSEDSEDSDDSDGEYNAKFSCEGKPYQVRGKALTCELHSLLYEIECNRMAEKAKDVIDPVMGRGHSNLPESKFHVLTKFRPKDTNLHQLHYEVSTNMGLCQSNMTYLIHRKGPTYHWVRELFGLMGLPEIDGIEEILGAENQQRMKKLQQKKTEKLKKQRVSFKQLRQQEQKKRRQFTKRQRIVHTYGDEEDEIDESEVLAAVLTDNATTTTEITGRSLASESEASTSKKACVCGGTNHSRRSSFLCPLNKRHSK